MGTPQEKTRPEGIIHRLRIDRLHLLEVQEDLRTATPTARDHCLAAGTQLSGAGAAVQMALEAIAIAIHTLEVGQLDGAYHRKRRA